MAHHMEAQAVSRYPNAEWVPWGYPSKAGLPTYYKGQNRPMAVVLHRMQGYAGTARQWAGEAHYGASWHYTVAFDGKVMQHLGHADGGYHAGIVDSAPPATWPLWKGRGLNVNHYTIGIECEGFAGGDWPELQLLALRDLCSWLAGDLGIPYSRMYFPPHADIDVVNRVNDFDTPERREKVYAFLFQEEEEDMSALEDMLLAVFSGSEEKDLPREKRLENARYRMARIAAGEIRSVYDVAASAEQIGSTGGELAPHVHDLIGGKTGGVA